MKYDLTANERLSRALLAEQEQPVKKRHGELPAASPVYLLGGTLFSALALFGLFMGFFLESPLGSLIAGGEPILHGSLFGVIVEIVRGSIPLPSWHGGLAGVLAILLYFMSILLALSILAELALSAFSFARMQQARKICFLNGALVVSVYGALLLLGLIRGAFTGKPVFDLPVALVLFAATALLTLLALARRGIAGLFNGLRLCCCLASWGIFAFAPFPETLDALFLGILDAKSLLTAALAAILGLNLILSLCFLGRKGKAVHDLLRFSIQLFVSLALGVVLLRAGLLGTSLSALFLLLPPIAGILSAVICHILFPSKKKTVDSPAADPMTPSL